MKLRTKKVIFAIAFAGVAMSNVVTSFAATSSTKISSKELQYSVSAMIQYCEKTGVSDYIVYGASIQGKDVQYGAESDIVIRNADIKNGKFKTVLETTLNENKPRISGNKNVYNNKKYKYSELRFTVDNRVRNVMEYNSELD